MGGCEAKSKLNMKRLEKQTEEQLRKDMENYKRKITRQLESSIEITLEIERKNIAELYEKNHFEEAASFASSCLNQHFPTLDRTWRDFFLVAIDKANKGSEEKYIVDREARLLTEEMDSLYFSTSQMVWKNVLKLSLNFQKALASVMWCG